MPRCLVQIYEVQRPDEAEALVEAGVDHIGTVLLGEGDWCQPSVKTVMEAIRTSPARSSLIPLSKSVDRISRALDYYRPDIVHFCESLMDGNGESGAVDRAFALQGMIRERFPGMRLMRSIPIAPAGAGGTVPSLSLAERFEAISDFFLTDTLLVGGGDPAAKQPVTGFVGITGRPCDWELAAKLVERSRIPVILAGGICPENVIEGIRRVRPAGVDSCTGTNAVDEAGHPIRFQKDMNRVREMVKRVRGLAANP
jgi:phosphoribosylanthranilate isomerase